jgi:hypothetical protein
MTIFAPALKDFFINVESPIFLGVERFGFHKPRIRSID